MTVKRVGGLLLAVVFLVSALSGCAPASVNVPDAKPLRTLQDLDMCALLDGGQFDRFGTPRIGLDSSGGCRIDFPVAAGSFSFVLAPEQGELPEWLDDEGYEHREVGEATIITPEAGRGDHTCSRTVIGDNGLIIDVSGYSGAKKGRCDLKIDTLVKALARNLGRSDPIPQLVFPEQSFAHLDLCSILQDSNAAKILDVPKKVRVLDASRRSCAYQLDETEGMQELQISIELDGRDFEAEGDDYLPTQIAGLPAYQSEGGVATALDVVFAGRGREAGWDARLTFFVTGAGEMDAQRIRKAAEEIVPKLG